MEYHCSGLTVSISPQQALNPLLTQQVEKSSMLIVAILFPP